MARKRKVWLAEWIINLREKKAYELLTAFLFFFFFKRVFQGIAVLINKLAILWVYNWYILFSTDLSQFLKLQTFQASIYSSIDVLVCLFCASLCVCVFSLVLFLSKFV